MAAAREGLTGVQKNPASQMSTDERALFVRPILLLRLEGLALALGAVAVYATTGGAWWLFALLLFLPDVSMIGYLRGPRLGAACYNFAHTTTLPILLAVSGHLAGQPVAVLVGLVWLTHVGVDRMLGYGLKSGSGFHDTHLGRIGRGDAT